MRHAVLAVCLAIYVLPGCAFGRSPPDVAAEYRQERLAPANAAAETSIWRMWRTADRLVREFDANETSEVWQRDGRTVFHTRYFHGPRRGIEFQQEDLSRLGAQPQWQGLAEVIPSEVLAKLTVLEEGVTDGHAWRRLEGTLDGVRWSVTMRTDLMLPVSLERHHGEVVERLTLLGAWPVHDAPRQPRSTEGYQVLDFADLGDNERDPFVMAVQGQLGLDHHHGH